LNENSQMKRSKQSKHAIVVPFKKRPVWLCTFAGKRPGVGSKAYRPSTTLTPPLRVRGSARRGLPGPPAGGRRGPAQRRRRGRRGAPAAGGRRSAAPPTPPRRCTPKAGDPFFPTREKGLSAIQEATDRTGGLVHPPLGHSHRSMEAPRSGKSIPRDSWVAVLSGPLRGHENGTGSPEVCKSQRARGEETRSEPSPPFPAPPLWGTLGAQGERWGPPGTRKHCRLAGMGSSGTATQMAPPGGTAILVGRGGRD